MVRPRDVSQRKATQRGGAESLNLSPLCIASCWLTSLGRKPRRTPYITYYVKTWRHPQNQKYIAYCTVIGEEPSHNRRQHQQKISWRMDVWFRRYTSGQTDKTPRHTDHNTLHPSQGRSNEQYSNNSITMSTLFYIVMPLLLYMQFQDELTWKRSIFVCII